MSNAKEMNGAPTNTKSEIAAWKIGLLVLALAVACFATYKMEPDLSPFHAKGTVAKVAIQKDTWSGACPDVARSWTYLTFKVDQTGKTRHFVVEGAHPEFKNGHRVEIALDSPFYVDPRDYWGVPPPSHEWMLTSYKEVSD